MKKESLVRGKIALHTTSNAYGQMQHIQVKRTTTNRHRHSEYLKKKKREKHIPLAHAVVHVGLGALDVIVQIVAEGLDVVDAAVAIGAANVRLEQHKRHEAVVLISLQKHNAHTNQ